jgi:hypothetical protein
MSTRIKMVGLALAAVFAMSAIAAASASAALPELVNKEGKELVKKGFVSTSGTSVFETKSGEKVTCKADTDKGEITGPKTDKAKITFTGCEAFGLKCNSKGAKAGEIILEVTSKYFYINKEKHEVGILLTLTAELTIECTAFQKLKVKGSTFCAVSPVNKLSTGGTITCKQTKGVQEPTELINEAGGKEKAPITETKGEGLKSFAFEQSGLTSTDTLTFEEEVELRA